MSGGRTRPNILFLFTDQQRPDWLGTNPDVPVETPILQSLADDGVQFTNAICPSPLCAPSRASIASGYEYDRCGVLSNHMEYPYRQPTYHRRLRDDAQYHVMGCGKFHIGHTQFNTARNVSWNLEGDNLLEFWGFSDGLFNEGLIQSAFLADGDPPTPGGPYTAFLDREGWLDAHVADYKRRSGVPLSDPLPRFPKELGKIWTATFSTPLPDDVYFDNWIGRNGLDLLDRAPTDQPWFLQINFQNPHHPWDVTEEMHAWYRDPPVDFPQPVASDLVVDPKTHLEIRRNYAAMVEHLDQWVGRFLDKLEERGELDETIVVFASDHGEMLGDHGQWQKMSPLQMSVGVPLVVAGPDVVDRDPVSAPVTILDLHATFLDYAGVSPPEEIDSQSMRPFLAGDADHHRDVVYSGLGPWRLVYDGRYKLIQGYDPDARYASEYEPWEYPPKETDRLLEAREPILHDVPASERENVADANPEIVARLSAELEAIRSGEVKL